MKMLYNCLWSFYELCSQVKWMMYWIVFAFFNAITLFTDIFISWFPGYYLFKTLFIIWLVSPATRVRDLLTLSNTFNGINNF